MSCRAMTSRGWAWIGALVGAAACGTAAPAPGPDPDPPAAPIAPVARPAPATDGAGVRLDVAFPPPAGAVRVPGEDGFGAWLAARTLDRADAPIRTHDGRVVHHDGRRVELSLVPGDLQQCADSLLRLRATWLRQIGRPVVFHATSGDPLPWARYREGERPWVDGGRIRWRPGGDGTFPGYLRHLFVWAGTASLAAHDTVPDTEPHPGDVLVDPGFPGHAVMLLDVARRGEETFVLVGEGFMPAQDFHVERGPHAGWWRWGPGIDLPAWRFGADHLHRWR